MDTDSHRYGRHRLCLFELSFLLAAQGAATGGKVVAAVGMIFFLLGVAAIIFSTVDYLNKRKQINAQTFQSPVTMVLSCLCR